MDELMKDLGVSSFEELVQYMREHPDDTRVKELVALFQMTNSRFIPDESKI